MKWSRQAHARRVPPGPGVLLLIGAAAFGADVGRPGFGTIWWKCRPPLRHHSIRTRKHPGVFRSATLAGVNDEAAGSEGHPGKASRSNPNRRSVVNREGAEIEMPGFEVAPHVRWCGR